MLVIFDKKIGMNFIEKIFHLKTSFYIIQSIIFKRGYSGDFRKMWEHMAVILIQEILK